MKSAKLSLRRNIYIKKIEILAKFGRAIHLGERTPFLETLLKVIRNRSVQSDSKPVSQL